jgi:hypothetical protein
VLDFKDPKTAKKIAATNSTTSVTTPRNTETMIHTNLLEDRERATGTG